ncbi:zinc finger protein 865-like isoform X22 [Amphibalanus amphitrite]|uniref:zinc finger protein 865-like isoform X22 n=1 Tax=Amphibalanus amphitrite TaxID=1232801 RepID=UPI001C91EFEF|nr:zinc finger protein 865-like isoform X22 [Amphibalanus amphitrite]
MAVDKEGSKRKEAAMFAPATSMSHGDLHGAAHVTQAEASSAGRGAPHGAPAYVTAATHSAPEEESIAMLSQMLQNEAQRHQREQRVTYAPAAGVSAKPVTSSADMMSELMDGSAAGGGPRVDAGRSGGGAEPAPPAQQVYLEPTGGAPAGAAPRISIDHLLGLPGFSGPIAPHFLAPRPAVFVPHPAHRGQAPPASVAGVPVSAAASAAAAAAVAAAAGKQDEAEKENGWQRTEIKREPGGGPEEAARGLLALHKQHYHRLGTEAGQPGAADSDELKRKAHMARHRRIHTNERPHVCTVCFKGFIRREHLQRHLKIHGTREPSERTHVCTVCYKAFIRKEHLQRHLKIHGTREPGERTHVCNICYKAFIRRDYLQRHMKIHGTREPSERTHVCTVCYKAFIRKEHLQRHMKIHGTREPGERTHVCNICYKAFVRRDYLQRHMKIHDPPLDEPQPRHPCDLCGSTFLRREHMRRHRKTHTGKKEHVCYLCGKAFFRREHVRKHVMSHTKSGSAAPTGRPERQPPATVQLQAGTATAQSLGLEGTDLTVDSAGGGLEPQPGPSHHGAAPAHQAHHLAQQQHQPQRRTPSDVPRNHVCTECGRRFSRKEHLQRHETTHSGTRPFACTTCHRTFNRKEHLKKHQQAPSCSRAASASGEPLKRESDESSLQAPPPPPHVQPPTSLLGFQPQLPQHVLLPQHMLGAVSTSHALDMSTQAQQQQQQQQQQPAHQQQPTAVSSAAAAAAAAAHMAAVSAGCEQTRPLQLLLK